MINDNDKTKEELKRELLDLNNSFSTLKKEYSEQIALLKLSISDISKSEEKFRKAYMTSPDSININRLSDGMFISVNEGFTKIMGYSKEEAVGKTSLELNIWADSADRIKLADEIQNKGKVENFEAIFIKKDGRNVNGLMSASLVDLDGVPHILSVTRDITIRRRTDLQNQIIYEITQGVSATSNLDELLKLIHHSLGKAVYAENCFVALYDQKTGLFSFPYFVDKFDSTPMPTSMGKSCSAYVFRNQKPFLFSQEIFDFLVEKNEVEQVGSFSPSWIGIPLQTPSRVIGVLVLQHYEKENVYSEKDVKFLISIGSQIAVSIERKKAEEEIKLKNLLLQKTNAEKDRFFSILAHDLRGPLSSFVGATQIISDDIQIMNIEEIKDITLRMKTSANNLYNLLENLLEWSRLKRDGLDFVPVRLDVKEKVEACLDVLSESARRKNIETSLTIPEGLLVFADNHMFDTVVRNLVSNAIKFTRTGGKVTVSAKRHSDHSIEVSISDTGIGMPAELKNKLFLIDEKTNRHGTEGEPSTGLGLLLCKEFIDKHNGKIWAESEVGKGSVFSFVLPENLN
jgi:PAS domain S-box-containing protein